MKRTPIIGATLAALALAATQAAAHEGAVCTNPDGTFVVVANSDGPITSIVAEGTGTVRFTWADGYTALMPVTGTCAPTAPLPAPASEVAPTTTPAPGQVTVIPDGYTPVRVTPSKSAKPRVRPRVVTCGFVLAHYRGTARARMIARHGITRRCGRPFQPTFPG